MAVHLNAGLNTRFIPILFSVALALIVASAAVHAHASGDVAQTLPGIEDPFASDRVDSAETSRDELRALMENANPERVDRRPGFSPITYDNPKKEEPVAEAFGEVTDQLQIQPPEAVSPDQR